MRDFRIPRIISIEQIKRRKLDNDPFGRHHGILFTMDDGQQFVIHLDEHGLQTQSVAAFMGPHNTYDVVRSVTDDNERHVILQRLRSPQAGKFRYDLLLENCEHFANWVMTGESRSGQVSNALVGVGALAFLGWLFSGD